jgi:hypothetical protein
MMMQIMMMMFLVKICFLSLGLLSITTCSVSAAAAVAIKVILKIQNDSGEYVAIHWVNPSTQQTSLMSNIEPNRTFIINSYKTHQFQIWQLPNTESGLCGGSSSGSSTETAAVPIEDQACKVNYFQVTESPEHHICIKKGLEVEIVPFISYDNPDATLLDGVVLGTDIEEPTKVMEKCKSMTVQMMNSPKWNMASSDILLKSYEDCIVKGVATNIKAVSQEVSFERDVRHKMATSMENFTCADVGLGTSTAVRVEDWTSTKDDATRPVRVMLDRPASRIHLIENFASVDECKAMEQEAQNRLSQASTADGKGGTKISLSRKALQASITPKFSQTEGVEDNLIAVLSSRVYEYTNYVLDLNITHHGQEPLMSIQYFGRGYNDTEPDRYTPHCDGKCEGLEHMVGARVATIVIYWYVSIIVEMSTCRRGRCLVSFEYTLTSRIELGTFKLYPFLIDVSVMPCHLL